MYYVYLIKSLKDSTKTYIGYTVNLVQRIEKHNSGASIYTADFRPWKLVTYICFDDESKAPSIRKISKSGIWACFCSKKTLVVFQDLILNLR